MSHAKKVAILVLLAVVMFILLFNFLKGQNVWEKKNEFYTVYNDITGLYPSDPVVINGFTVGKVGSFTFDQKNRGKVIVPLILDENIVIPRNSLAILFSADLLGEKMVKIIIGDGNEYYQPGDTINTKIDKGVLADIGSEITPLTDKLDQLMVSLDTTITGINSLFNRKNETNLYKTIDELNSTLSNLNKASAGLTQVIESQKQSIQNIIMNAESFTANLKGNNEEINEVIANLSKFSKDLEEANIDETINTAKAAIEELNVALGAINNGDGTLNTLIHKPQTAQNIENAIMNLNSLIVDLQQNPGRYINVSVFGRKDK